MPADPALSLPNPTVKTMGPQIPSSFHLCVLRKSQKRGMVYFIDPAGRTLLSSVHVNSDDTDVQIQYEHPVFKSLDLIVGENEAAIE